MEDESSYLNIGWNILFADALIEYTRNNFYVLSKILISSKFGP